MPNKINEVRCTSTKTSVGLGFIFENFNMGCNPHGVGDIETVNIALRNTVKYRLAVANVINHGDKYTIGFEGLHLNEVIMFFLNCTIGNLTIDNKKEDGAMNNTDRLNYIRSILGQAAVIGNYVANKSIDCNAILDATVAYLNSVDSHLVPGLSRLVEILNKDKGTDRVPAICGWYMSATKGANLDMKSGTRKSIDEIPFKVNRALLGLFNSFNDPELDQYMEKNDDNEGEFSTAPESIGEEDDQE